MVRPFCISKVSPRLRFDEVLIEAHRAGQAVVFDVLIQAVHTLHLLGAVDDWRKADAARAYRLIELRVGRAGHDVGTDRQAGEGLADDLVDELKRLAVYVDRLGRVVGVDDLRLKAVLCGKGFDDLKALLFTLMRDEAHVCAERRLLR